MRSPDLERVAETHYFIRPLLNSALKRHVFTPEGQAFYSGHKTYADVWIDSLSDKFFDMGTLIRAAASIETALRSCYMTRKGHANLSALNADPLYKQNIFQRVMPWHGADSATSLMDTVGVNLTALPELASVQELVLHRHIYAHNLGVADESYIERLKLLSGNDIRAQLTSMGYPDQDVFWFEPLSRLPEFIEHSRSFLRALP